MAEQHYCYSCRGWHGFLDAAEWAEVEPLWRRAQLGARHAGRVARRLRRPIQAEELQALFRPAMDKYAAITGDRIDNLHNLYHRQLVHDCKWRPRVDDPGSKDHQEPAEVDDAAP